MSIPSIKRFTTEYLEIRIRGAGTTGKGDRTGLLSASDARILAYSLLTEAELLEKERTRKAKP